MKIVHYQEPKSSFLSMDKDMEILTDLICKNELLKKMLFYPTPDCLTKPNLTDKETASLFGKQIKIVPKFQVDSELFTYLVISFDNFSPSGNPQFRDNTIEFDIVCHFNQWQLKDYALRPYKIAAELDSMLSTVKLTNLGSLDFMGATSIVLTDEFAGLCLLYEVVHGKEDKINAPNPIEDQRLKNNFNQMFNEN